MRFDTSQHMRLGQQMRMAPRMIQSMEILQMPLMQLEERIEQELESNITLELAEPEAAERIDGAAPESTAGGVDAATSPLNLDSPSSGDDFARLDSYESANPEAGENEFDDSPASTDRADTWEPSDYSSRDRATGETDHKSEALNNTAAPTATLTEQLREQWSLADVEESLRQPGELIISFIEDDGYLRTDLPTIADRCPPTMGKPEIPALERALRAVQLLLEPTGVGARDTRECLLLQLDALEGDQSRLSEAEFEDWRNVRKLVESHLEDLAQNRLPRIAEKTGLSIAQIQRAMEKMRRLSLAPARALVEESATPIIPDAIVEFDADAPGGGRYIAYLNDNRLPALRINREYAAMARDRGVPRQTRDFVKSNLNNAAWLIDAVEQRRRTLLRVINIVVEAQRDAFDYGPQALKPLPMTQVAEQLGVHVATVSRAVADKHILTPRGIVALRSYFSGGTQTDSGEDMSWDAIKAALKEIIEAEDRASPMSDDALADELKKRGIEIARRTVAKYRDQLGIPSARLRKTF